MKALQYSEYGPSSVLHVVDVPEPQPGAGRIRVAVRAVGVNPFDWKVRSGAFGDTTPSRLPVIPHSDVAGVVDAVGDGVQGVAVGDHVFGVAVGGGAAEFAVLKEWAQMPVDMSFEEAAGLPNVVETAGRALGLLGLEKGQTVLVNGAAGGVGIAAVQLAVSRGATVIGTASERNHDFVRRLGATPVTYGPGLPERVRALAETGEDGAGRGGVDLALDTAGRGAVEELVTLTPTPADVVSIADFEAPKFGARVTDGSEGRAYETLNEAAILYSEGQFTMPVERTFPLAEAAAAHDLSESGHVRGKVVITL
ncbi:NADP-dependent oxidoreductase [Dactylosporangium vinaceum]|uniref:NADP-dependent oxidoreductase n=1 Tax=Dactylosporangium vinaceum TaxID=53362 RepID=A0ABV5M8L2_9ACTN|nr:NADP-dependent oxidoreductase [Dactylosporangium vinaceum]UAB94577.1 NADP-dependent oxidoreductase [Dactylosporangium vinaceum]